MPSGKALAARFRRALIVALSFAPTKVLASRNQAMKRMFRMDAHLITGTNQCARSSLMRVSPMLLPLRSLAGLRFPHFVEWTSFAIILRKDVVSSRGGEPVRDKFGTDLRNVPLSPSFPRKGCLSSAPLSECVPCTGILGTHPTRSRSSTYSWHKDAHTIPAGRQCGLIRAPVVPC